MTTGHEGSLPDAGPPAPTRPGTGRNGSYATREQVLGFHQYQTEDVEIPEWGGLVVRVRELTAQEKQEFDSAFTEATQRIKLGKGKSKDQEIELKIHAFRMKVRAVILAAQDAHGGRLFRDEDAKSLGEKSARAVDRLYSAITRLSGIGAEEEEAIDEAGKGSSSTPGADPVSP